MQAVLREGWAFRLAVLALSSPSRSASSPVVHGYAVIRVRGKGRKTIDRLLPAAVATALDA
ncbi:hypothetical protein [Actinopolymorpha alba]|uniref:hypothetical protein n=1 Tax=Actinopolymorpha alba TaxID=533267 RepID=UPI00037D9C6E|nr:hypothetical protein [Actinopolymorpha alba]